VFVDVFAIDVFLQKYLSHGFTRMTRAKKITAIE